MFYGGGQRIQSYSFVLAHYTDTNLNNNVFWTSGQDEGMGRYTVPPHTTKRRTTNLKTKYNQNCQKIELHGTLTTKKLKKHSPRLVGGVETGNRKPSREDMQQGRAG